MGANGKNSKATKKGLIVSEKCADAYIALSKEIYLQKVTSHRPKRKSLKVATSTREVSVCAFDDEFFEHVRRIIKEIEIDEQNKILE